MARTRSLWPREHGAYGQLAAPLTGALVVHRPTAAALLLAVAACCAFLANEPLLVVLGQRGERMRASHGTIAARRLALAVVAAAGCASLGLVLGSLATLEIAAFAAIPSGCLVALAWSRRQHSLGGELIAALAFPGAAAPVLVAGGAPVGDAATVWAAWSLGYACSVFAVHRVLARHRRPADIMDRALAVAIAVVVVASLALHARLPAAGIAAPLAAVALYLVVRPVPAKRMRAIGVALLVASFVGIVILVAA